MQRIDVHAHMIPHGVFDRLPTGMERVEYANGTVGVTVGDRDAGRGVASAARHLHEHRERQAARGIDVSLISPWVKMVKAPDVAQLQIPWCRAINDELSRVTSDVAHSRYLAALPDLDGGAAADVLAEAVAGGAVGGILAANSEAGHLGRGELDPLWREASRLQVPLVIHPGYFTPPPGIASAAVNTVAYTYETTLAAFHLIDADIPSRFPDLSLLLVHGGGYLPYQYARISTGIARARGGNGVYADLPPDYLRWFFYDAALFDGAPVRYLTDLVGPDRVLAGTDCPLGMTDDLAFRDPDSLGLDAEALTAVLGGNAARIFRLDAPAAG